MKKKNNNFNKNIWKKKTQFTQNTQEGGNTKTPSKRYRRLCFTLNNWTEDEFTQLLSRFDNMKYVIGKEVGKCGTPHLQGYVEFGRQLSFKQIKAINERMHIEKSRGNRKQNIAYCTKDGDFTTTFPVPRNVRLLGEYAETVWLPWQEDIIKLIESEPNSRSVNWYWETKGNIGKSYLSRYLYLKYDAIICSGKSSDVFNQVLSWTNANEEMSPKVVVCDIPRQALNYVNYSCMEKLKDGLIYSGKYEGGVVALDKLHVICFANERPDTYTMSSDRWNIINLRNEVEVETEEDVFVGDLL